MSSNNLPRVMISAARPSFSSDSRKMSFLSADGRLEDRGRRESRDSRGSLESDMSIRIGRCPLGGDVNLSDDFQIPLIYCEGTGVLDLFRMSLP